MAGDWMKVELDLPDKPEIYRISGITGLDPDAVAGKLLRVWGWFNKHTVDGNAHSVTFLLIDRISGVTGFGEAMMLSGWLVQNDSVLTMPKFDRHTSESAKARALAAKRVQKSKAKSNANGNAEGNALTVTSPLPREEKRREELTTSVAHEKIVFDGRQFQNVNGQAAIWAEAYPAINIQQELAKAAAWLVANPKNKKSNYGRFLNNWLKSAQDKAPRVDRPAAKTNFSGAI